MRLALIAPTLALRAGLHALIAFPHTSEAADRVALEAASLDEYAASGVEADVLLIAGEALEEAALRRCLDGEQARLGVVALSDRPGTLQLLMGLALSGWCVLPEDAGIEELQAGLRATAAGLAAAPPALFDAAVRRPQLLLTDDLDTGDAGPEQALTERERQVLEQLARGLANKQIALALGISEHTVKFHVSSIYAKLGAGNRTEAVRAGVRRGLISL